MERLGPAGSDCGSTKYREVFLTESEKADKNYRYILDKDELVLLDDTTYGKYVGKTVKMRTPMYCKGVDGNQHVICNKCAGELYYKTGKVNVGLLVSVCTQTLSNADLQKFHDNTIHIKEIDVDDMLL